MVSTLKGPNGSELADGKYRPSLAPTTLLSRKSGSAPDGVFGTAVHPELPWRVTIHSEQLQQFTPNDGKAENSVVADPSLPDYLRDVQFTVNGQFQPTIKSKPGQTEIWVLANVSDMAYMNVQLTETATDATSRSPSSARMATPIRGALSGYREWDAVADPTGKPLRDCRDDAGKGRPHSRDAATRRRREDDYRAGGALHQQWQRYSARRAWQA